MGGQRVHDRKKRRMPCQIQVGNRAHSGLVLDLSPSGLFVQTNAKTRTGQQITLRLATEDREPIELAVEVVRQRLVPAQLLALAKGGVGVRITSAPDGYFRFLRKLRIEGGEADPALAPQRRFRVRVQQIGGPRSRRLEIEAADAGHARERAVEDLGDEWKVLAVEEL